MPNTYVALRTETVATATPSVTFSLSGISGYTDLIVVANLTVATAGGNMVMTFNGDTTSGLYSKTQIEGTGSSAFSGRTANANNIGLDSNMGEDTTNPSIHIIQLMNYANTSVFKTVLHRQAASWTANPGTALRVGLWRNTNAITSITLSNGATNINVGSTFSLYGIANAPALTAKATGGTIYYGADGYVYHRFTGSGSFVPSSNLSADCLVVAGGGGGGAGAVGGGGGAGGLRGLVSQSLTSGITYSVTVGGGGTAGVWEFTKGGTGGPSSISGTGLTTITAAGGGGGGSGDQATAAAGNSGGSGGGGCYIQGAGGAGNTPATTPPQGNNGAAGASNTNYGGGGGGASVAGLIQNGGNGSSDYSVWGSATSSGQYTSGVYWYAGGGGGGVRNSAGIPLGAGGNGGGGTGSKAGLGTAGTTNTGGGGGGTGWEANNTAGGSAGGSGIVIIRYLG